MPNGRPIFVRLWTKFGSTWYSKLYQFQTTASDNSIAQQVDELRKANDAKIAELAKQNQDLLKKINDAQIAITQKVDAKAQEILNQGSANQTAVLQILNTLKTGVERIDSTIGINHQNLVTLSNQMMDKLRAVETTTTANTAAIAAIQADIDAMAAQINLMDQSVIYIEGQVAQIDDLVDSVDRNSQDIIDEVIAQSTAIKNSLNSISSSVSGVRTAVDAVSAKIDVKTNLIRDDLFALETEVLRNRTAIERVEDLVQSGGTGSSNIRINDYLEVYYNGEWRGVCDDSFDLNDAKVACRQLGRSTSNVTYSTGVSGSSSAYWLDEMACTGGEYSLFECGHATTGTHNCSASEHVRVVCN